eukprot:1141844-Pelagomonas_calceolata.AAC.3
MQRGAAPAYCLPDAHAIMLQKPPDPHMAKLPPKRASANALIPSTGGIALLACCNLSLLQPPTRSEPPRDPDN